MATYRKIINPQGRKRKNSLRGIMDAIFYTLKTGCQWRMLPKNFAPWQSVFYYFNKWKNEGVIEELLDVIRVKVKKFSVRKIRQALTLLTQEVSRHLIM